MKLQLALAAALPLAAQAATKPNLLFIVTDEHSFRTLGCYRELMDKEQAEMWGPGNVVETPNLDRIAHNGVTFNRMYCSTPTSTPARAAMFTGFYGVQLCMENNSAKPGDGKYLKADVPTIAQSLQKAGYKTGYAGKIHLAEARSKDQHEWWSPYPVGHEGYNYGFEDNKYMFNGGHCKWLGIGKDGFPYFLNKAEYVGVEDGRDIFKDVKTGNKAVTMTDFLSNCAIDFIDKNSDKPFYYVLSIPDPHTGDLGTGRYNTMYTHMKFQKPISYDFGVAAKEANDEANWQHADGKATKIVEYNIAQYFGMVKHIDDNIGRILDKLEQTGVLENTIIVFTADHGELMGEHARMNKGTVHEASARVPFIMCHGMKSKNPLVPRGVVNNLAANTTDWMPTFMSLLGVEPLKGMGRDLTPILDGNAPKGWNNVTFCTKRFIAAMDSKHKLHVNSSEKRAWFMDTDRDPNEMTNLIDDPAYNEVIVKLAKELLVFNEKVTSNNKDMKKVLEDLISKRK